MVLVNCDYIYVIRTYIAVGVAPSHIAVHQDGPTAVDVEIDADDQGSETVSYHIYYTGTTSGSVSVNASPSKHMHVPIKDLVNGGSYVISVVAKSVHLESAPVVAEYSPISLSKYQWPVRVPGNYLIPSLQHQVLLN